LRSALLVLLATTAHARPFHGSIAVGGSTVATGSDGDRLRNEVSLDLKPRSRYGLILGYRGWDAYSLDDRTCCGGDGDHDGFVTAGVVFEAGAARPRLVLDLVGEVGWDLDQTAPLAGAGIRNTVGVIGPLAVILHGSLYVVVDGSDSRVQLQGNLLVGAKF
jgi:hypothetical protein